MNPADPNLKPATPMTQDDLLKRVSRSFYLTLRILPRAVRHQIGLAYLLARAADTIADTQLISPDRRRLALAALRRRILAEDKSPLDLSGLARHQDQPAERVLVENIEFQIELLDRLDAEDASRVRQVLAVITSGQELDLRRFPAEAASPGCPVALQTDAELDDYTYRVAGCVGEFWTRMCRAHLYPGAPMDETRMIEDGARFGKGLQLINIVRDLPADLRRGRCYIPAERLEGAGLDPARLLDPSSVTAFRPVCNGLLDEAEAHLAAGWRYTNAIPRSQWRVRLACAWPVLIGLRTIELLRTENVLDPGRRIKVPRAEIHDLMLRSLCAAPFPGIFRGLWSHCSTAGKSC